jgi:hypothetical protein
MVMRDKRDECGCHKGCTVLPHHCDKPCVWPSCLTEAEHTELAADVAKDFEVCPTCEMIVSDCEMYGCPRKPEAMHVVGLLRKYNGLHDALAVLRDVVALEDEPHPNCHTHEECGAWQDDYRRRNTAAWARARSLVAEHTTNEETT